MKYYTSCFLGIPLLQDYTKQFEQLLIDIHSIDPLIETVQPQTPHITVYYLNQQSQFSLNEISRLIQHTTSSLSTVNLKVGGFDCFTKENPKVLFLDVDYPTSLTDFNKEISKLIIKYSASNNSLPFHPHMTVGRMKNTQSQESFKMNEKKLKSRLNTINWSFKVNEVTLYGVDSNESPEYQEKLLTISVK